MPEFSSLDELPAAGDAVREHIDTIVRTAVFAKDAAVRDAARRLIRAAAPRFGVRTASIQNLYDAFGRGEVKGFTVPAINVRMMTYDTARAICRAAVALDTGAVIFELANSEMGYAAMDTFEYFTVIAAAAIREGFQGPLFVQGDHYQFKPAKFKENRDKELQRLKDLAKAALDAGYRNIDIDASTLVDLSHDTVGEQQRDNYEMTAELTRFIRAHQPAGVTVSVGGEIGEVGAKNSTVEELRAYVDGYLDLLEGVKPCSKISVQTGTTHGGLPRPDGSVADVAIDFDALQQLSAAARGYGMGGAVQHGASTLPDDLFDHFPKRTTLEIHLATGFQNLIYDHPRFPKELRAEMYDHAGKHHADERKKGYTDEQFLYKARKYAIGPFKRACWDLPADTREAIGRDLQAKFEFLFRQLGVPKTREVVDKHVKPVADIAG